MRYYDLRQNWPKVLPHLEHHEVQAILFRDFNKYTVGRWDIKFKKGKYPNDFEISDIGLEYQESPPEFFRYVKIGACHWIVNFALKLAMLTEPDFLWRIITSDKHSTVWDGKDTLFDFNYQALGVNPNDCYKAAVGYELKPSKYMTVFVPGTASFL